MTILRTIKLIGRFYRNFLLVSLLLTAVCLEIFFKYGFTTFFALFWFKLATLGLTYYYINSNKQKEYYYYQNLGLSRSLLWGSTLGFDFILFLFLITRVYLFR